jgi:hypothetical protein
MGKMTANRPEENEEDGIFLAARPRIGILDVVILKRDSPPG